MIRVKIIENEKVKWFISGGNIPLVLFGQEINALLKETKILMRNVVILSFLRVQQFPVLQYYILRKMLITKGTFHRKKCSFAVSEVVRQS